MTRRFWIIAFTMSLFLHLLLLVIFLLFVIRPFPWLLFWQKKDESPVVQEKEKKITLEIVETPKESVSSPENPDAFSDKMARSADQRTDDIPFTEDPFGEWRLKQQAAGMIGQQSQRSQLDQRKRPSQYGYTYRPDVPFTREQLTGQRGNSKPSPRMTESRKTDKNANVEAYGEFSLNTYAWDYAPYMLGLKDAIQNHIFPPPVYTHLGFGGVNVIRFRINRDGSIETPNLIAYKGEKILINTSKSAIDASSPFPPLPGDFPEPYLEITAKFSYFTYRPIKGQANE